MRKDWIKLPMWIFTEIGLKPTEACILALLIDNAKTRNWKAEITQKAISEQLNVTDRTVRNALDLLQSKGLIKSRRTDRASVYEIQESARIEQAIPPKRDDYSRKIMMLRDQAIKKEKRAEEQESSFTIEDIKAICNKPPLLGKC